MKPILEHHYYAIFFAFLSTVIAVNIPLGILRSRFRKFSRPWARCIYIPILFNIALRRLIGFTLMIVPYTLLSVLIGQFIGIRFREEILRLLGRKIENAR